MVQALNRTRAKRTPSSLADQLYPENGPQDESPDDEGEADAPEETGAPRTPMQRAADSLYPEKGRDDAGGEEEDDTGETDQDADDPDGADQEDEGNSDDDASDDEAEQPKPKKNSSQNRATPKIINGSISESYDDHVKTGGSRSWRANNPGNLEYHGQKGTVGKEKAGRFAKFATEEAGMAALKKLLGSTYKDWSVSDLMTKKYAPPGGEDNNDPKAYIEFLGKHGVDLKKPVGQQIDVMAEAIKKQEGWIPGTIKNKK